LRFASLQTALVAGVIFSLGEIMNIFKRVLLPFTLLVSVNVTGAPIEVCTAIGCTAKIETLYLNPNGTIQMTMDSAISKAPLGCTLADGYFTLKKDNVHFSEMYSMILAAHMAQRPINLRTIAGSSNCEIWYSVLY
jgi:hypothetical protein